MDEGGILRIDGAFIACYRFRLGALSRVERAGDGAWRNLKTEIPVASLRLGRSVNDCTFLSASTPPSSRPPLHELGAGDAVRQVLEVHGRNTGTDWLLALEIPTLELNRFVEVIISFQVRRSRLFA